MKKKATKIVTVLLAFVLAMQSVGFAYAASDSWSDSYYSYSASVTKGSSNNQSKYTGASSTHTKGTSTTIYATSSKTLTSSRNGSFPSAYKTRLEALYTEEGLVSSATRSVVAGSSSVNIPSGVASGTYYFNVTFYGYSVKYSVIVASPASLSLDSDAVSSTPENASGTLSYAPTGSSVFAYSTTKGS